MGHELDSDVSPFEVGLHTFTRKSGGFTGYEALLKRLQQSSTDQVSTNQIVSLTFADDFVVPLGHEPVIYNNDIIGKTTSCAFGYRVGKPIALAQASSVLVSGIVQSDETVEVDIGGSLYEAHLSVSPLFDATGTRMKI